ncbi:YesL family protein [Alkalicoccobacillus porphyridii]|nr:DUF624 domain-containing protein [Alkalicoccobacillus porphyridii]
MNVIKALYEVSNWLAKVMYLHLLWTGFTLVGLVIFGIAPATTALCAVIHKWYNEDFDVPIFKNFYAVYKSEFKKSNGLGFIVMFTALFLYVDLQISEQFIQSFFIHAIILIIGFLSLITAIYLFPVFVRYELPFFTYFKQSFYIAIARPMETLAILVSFVLMYFLFSVVPVLFVFAGSSIIATPMVWFAYRACIQIEDKKTAASSQHAVDH